MASNTLTHDELIALFEKRFDYYSARAMITEAMKDLGGRPKDTYTNADLEAIIGVLPTLQATRVEGLLEVLKVAAAALTPPAKVEAKPVKVEEPKADAPAEPAPKAEAEPKKGKKD
jgi:hypothetical protein